MADSVIVPAGFARITPYLIVEGAEACLAFLVAAFDGVETGRSLRPDGGIANGQVRIGDATVMVGEASADGPPMPTTLYLYVADADATTAQAIAAGGTLVMPIGDMPYGDRQSGVRDPTGTIWWISQRLTAAPYYPGG